MISSPSSKRGTWTDSNYYRTRKLLYYVRVTPIPNRRASTSSLHHMLIFARVASGAKNNNHPRRKRSTSKGIISMDQYWHWVLELELDVAHHCTTKSTSISTCIVRCSTSSKQPLLVSHFSDVIKQQYYNTTILHCYSFVVVLSLGLRLC